MLATVDELASYMDQSFSNRQKDAADLVLAGLQEELEMILRRPVGAQSFTETYVIPGDYLTGTGESIFYNTTSDFTSTSNTDDIRRSSYVLHLRNSPVHSVTSVKVTPRYSGATQTTLVAGQDYVVLRWGLELFSVYPHDEIEVAYSAGLDTGLGYLKIVLLRAAAREMTNQTDDTLGLKDMQTNQAPVAPVGFTPDEIAVIKNKKRKQV